MGRKYAPSENPAHTQSESVGVVPLELTLKWVSSPGQNSFIKVEKGQGLYPDLTQCIGAQYCMCCSYSLGYQRAQMLI